MVYFSSINNIVFISITNNVVLFISITQTLFFISYQRLFFICTVFYSAKFFIPKLSIRKKKHKSLKWQISEILVDFI